jgi:hypothetical protein
MYQRKAAPAAAKPPASDVVDAAGQGNASGNGLRTWDMYGKSVVSPAVKAPATRKEIIDTGVRDPPAQPFIVYRDPSPVRALP